MAPKSSASKTGSQQGAQQTISHFFMGGKSTPGASTKRTRSPVDLTLDSDEEEPPSKRVKLLETSNERGFLTKQALANPKHDSPMKKKYKYISLEDSPAKPTVVIDESIKKTQEARRKRMKETLRQINNFARSSPVRSEQEGDSHASSDADADSDSKEYAAENLHKRFASKVAVSAGRDSETTAKGKKRKQEELGPSGKPYTPLELQIKQMKEENPGTLLMFEVGYKYRLVACLPV